MSDITNSADEIVVSAMLAACAPESRLRENAANRFFGQQAGWHGVA